MKVRIFLIITVIFLLSCRKERNHPVISIPFDITVNISLPSYIDLQGVGGWAYVNGGVSGIIVYRKSVDEFVAFDRKSPANDGAECETPLTVNEDNFLELDDPCTNAKFSLFDGSPISGSEYGLRQYQVVWDGSNILRIFN